MFRIVLLATAFLQVSLANTVAKSGFLSPQNGGINIESLLSDALKLDQTSAPADKPASNAGNEKVKQAILETRNSLSDLLRQGSGSGSESAALGDLLTTLDASDPNVQLSNSALDLIENTLMKQIVKENNLTKATLDALRNVTCSNATWTPPTENLDSSNTWHPNTYDYSGQNSTVNYSTCRALENQSWIDIYDKLDEVYAVNATIAQVCPCNETMDCSAASAGESFRDYLVRMVAWFQAQKQVVENRTTVCNALNANKTALSNEVNTMKSAVTDAMGNPVSPCCTLRTSEESHVCNEYRNMNDHWNTWKGCVEQSNTSWDTAVTTAVNASESQKLQMRLALRMKCLFNTFFNSSNEATGSAEQQSSIETCIQTTYEQDAQVLALNLDLNASFQIPNPVYCEALPGTNNYSQATYGFDSITPRAGVTFTLPTCAGQLCTDACEDMHSYLNR